MEIQKAITLPKCHIEKNGLTIEENISRDEWHNIGGVLKTMEGCIQFWIGDWLRFGEKKWGEMYKEAEEITGLENTTLRTYKSVAENVLSRDNNLSFSHHKAVASLPKEKQKEFLKEAKEKGYTRNELTLEVAKEKRKDITKESVALPNNKYSTIVIDPPWDLKSMVLNKWEQTIEEKYPSMSVEEIISLDIPKIANDDCSLFMWTTHTYLQEALDIIKAWGFKYHCCLTWDKIGGFSLCGFHRRTEFCLYSYIGKMNINQSGEFIPTVFQEAKRKHSQKPDIFDRYIVSNTPAPRVEVFARIKKEGFDVWGNQL